MVDYALWGGLGDLSAVAQRAEAEAVTRRYEAVREKGNGGLRGVYHRARVRATRWLIRPTRYLVHRLQSPRRDSI
jgi:hypothetical protein